jgi:DNA-3-methyladenine glycosylase
MFTPPRLGREFYNRPALETARELLGARLVRLEGGRRLAGLILETEAYGPEEDLGCHCRSGRTPRTQVMYGPPGHAYVYFTYGKHWMLNFVVAAEGFPAAVLIRALLPLEGVEAMVAHREQAGVSGRRLDHLPRAVLTGGPAKLCQALAITGRFNGLDLCSPEAELFVEAGERIPEEAATLSPRVGLNTVPEPWKSVPWRFRVSGDFAAGLIHPGSE